VREAAHPDDVVLKDFKDLSVRGNLASHLHIGKGMSVLRTVSLIAGGALVALGGSALALFI
jgi:hypothetical protein